MFSPIVCDAFSVGDRVMHYRDPDLKGEVVEVAENGLSVSVHWDGSDTADEPDFQWQGKLVKIPSEEDTKKFNVLLRDTDSVICLPEVVKVGLISTPRKLTYCSFATPQKCLGVCVLEGNLSPVEACKVAWQKNINPGGELFACECAEDNPDVPGEVFEVMWANRDRLIPAEEARALFDCKSLGEFEAAAGVQTNPICPYCNTEAVLVTGERIYPHRPDLADRKIWLCEKCGAYVGCHPGTEAPLGRLADAELRAAKMAAHTAFDVIWKKGNVRRSIAYRWLAEQLKIPNEQCHIGMFDVDLCQRVVDVCSKHPSECTCNRCRDCGEAFVFNAL